MNNIKNLLCIILFATSMCAFAEESKPCVAPSMTGSIPDYKIEKDSFDATRYFSGTNLRYTLNSSQSDCVNMTDGIVKMSASAGKECQDLRDVTITAMNACGAVTSNTFVIFG